MTNEIKEAKKIIEDGGLVVFPTETAYGIAADATNKEAVEKVYKAKHRPREKGITAIVKDIEQAREYGQLSKKEEKLIEEFMPGPLTLVASKKDQDL